MKADRETDYENDPAEEDRQLSGADRQRRFDPS